MAGPSFYLTLLRIGAIFLGVVLSQSIRSSASCGIRSKSLGCRPARPTRIGRPGPLTVCDLSPPSSSFCWRSEFTENSGENRRRPSSRALAPMRLIGIGRGAVPLAMSGLLLGLNYGGALMIREARFGTVSRRDVFLSICFLCLCLGVIEDTLCVMALGADWTGVLLARVVFALVVVGVLAHVVHRMPDEPFERYLCAEAGP